MTPEIQALTEGLKEAKRQGNQRAALHLADKLEQIRAQSIEAPVMEQPSLGERVIHGIREPALGALQFVSNKLPAVGDKIDALDKWAANTKIGKAVGLVAPQGGYRQAVPAWQKEYDKNLKETGFEGVDWGRLAGNIVSPVNLAIGAGVGSAAKGIGGKIAGALRDKIPAAASGALKALGVGGAGVASGAAGALTAPISDDGDFDEQKMNQLRSGAILGGALSVAGPAIGRVLNPQTSKNVKLLLKEGVTPTPGQILGGIPRSIEDRATSLPLIGDIINASRQKGINEFNKAAYARVLKPIGRKLEGQEIGRDAVRGLRHAVADEYNSILPRLSFKPDDDFYAAVQKSFNAIKDLPEDKQRGFAKVMNDFMGKIESDGGVIDGNKYKNAISELKRIGADYMRDSSIDNRLIGSTIKGIADASVDGVKRTNPTSLVAKLNNADTAHALRKRVGSAASLTGAKEGVFSPAQLRASVRAQDKTFDKRAYTEGGALLQDLSDAGVDVLSPVYPDSGTAGRLFAGSLLGGGLGGGLAAGSPIGAGAAIGAGVAALPYVAGGREVAAALLARRPNFTRAVSAYPGMAIKAATPGLVNYTESGKSY